MIESLPLAVTRVSTMLGERNLTNATGFFFERDERLYLVTSRHVVLDEPSKRFPDRIEIELHVNPENLAETVQFSIPLYQEGKLVWKEGLDSAGAVDVVARAFLLHGCRARFAPLGVELVGSTPADFAAHIETELRKWEDVVRRSGAKLD